MSLAVKETAFSRFYCNAKTIRLTMPLKTSAKFGKLLKIGVKKGKVTLMPNEDYTECVSPVEIFYYFWSVLIRNAIEILTNPVEFP